jgi:hypothetical protein
MGDDSDADGEARPPEDRRALPDDRHSCPGALHPALRRRP